MRLRPGLRFANLDVPSGYELTTPTSLPNCVFDKEKSKEQRLCSFTRVQTQCLSPIGRTQFFLLFTAITTDYSLTAISMTTCLGDGFAEGIIL